MQTEMFIVYWDPGARNLGIFPTKSAAEAFINSVIQNNYAERNEFCINSMAFQPDPATIEL